MTNWKTTLSGIASAIFAALSILAASSYELGEVATIISPEYKPLALKLCLAATVFCKIVNSIVSKDANSAKPNENLPPNR